MKNPKSHKLVDIWVPSKIVLPGEFLSQDMNSFYCEAGSM